jgi:hypothetical protein
MNQQGTPEMKLVIFIALYIYVQVIAAIVQYYFLSCSSSLLERLKEKPIKM